MLRERSSSCCSGRGEAILSRRLSVCGMFFIEWILLLVCAINSSRTCHSPSKTATNWKSGTYVQRRILRNCLRGSGRGERNFQVNLPIAVRLHVHVSTSPSKDSLLTMLLTTAINIELITPTCPYWLWRYRSTFLFKLWRYGGYKCRRQVQKIPMKLRYTTTVRVKERTSMKLPHSLRSLAKIPH